MSRFVVFILCLLCLNSFAQSQKHEIGLLGGPSIVSQKGTFSKRFDNRDVGFNIELLYKRNFTKIISLRSGLSFERKGLNFPAENINQINDPIIITLEIKRKYNYITLPVFLQTEFGKTVKVYLNAGPYLSVFINQKYVQILDGSIHQNQVSSVSSREGEKSIDLGFSFGVGCAIPINDNFKILVEARENLGILDTKKSSFLTDKHNTISFEIGASYSLNNKKETEELLELQ
jgi:opacity protein-like surface antigen